MPRVSQIFDCFSTAMCGITTTSGGKVHDERIAATPILRSPSGRPQCTTHVQTAVAGWKTVSDPQSNSETENNHFKNHFYTLFIISLPTLREEIECEQSSRERYTYGYQLLLRLRILISILLQLALFPEDDLEEEEPWPQQARQGPRQVCALH